MESGVKGVTVAFVDDHPIVVAGMSAIFSTEQRFRVLATGASAKDLRAIANQHRPDLLIVDLSMPGDVCGAISDVVQQHSSTRVIVLSAFSGIEAALRSIKAGAIAFVLKGSGFDDLFEAIEAALRGELYVAKPYLSQVMDELRNSIRGKASLNLVKLSVREKQIVRHLMEARTNREIAIMLNIGEQTVKNYMSGLMSKLKARNRVEVVMAAQKNSDFS